MSLVSCCISQLAEAEAHCKQMIYIYIIVNPIRDFYSCTLVNMNAS